MRHKQTKEAIRKSEKQKSIEKVRNLGANAPLSKYYREQINAETSLMVGDLLSPSNVV
jgi:hypothetical protein